jgi:DNA invertase Pin-like site-specific DNA recombinase
VGPPVAGDRRQVLRGEGVVAGQLALGERRGVGFKSLGEQLDTTTPGGRLVFHLFGALAEFERDLLRERTAAGLAAARARDRKGGGPRS